jgi:hypothetical protein
MDCEPLGRTVATAQVFQKFDALVAEHKGAPLNDYTLRLIGSDTEHFIRKLLQASAVPPSPSSLECPSCTAWSLCTLTLCTLSLRAKNWTMRKGVA